MIRSLRQGTHQSNQTSDRVISQMRDSHLKTVIERLQKNDPDLEEVNFQEFGGFNSYHLNPSGSNQQSSFQQLLDALRSNYKLKKVNIVIRLLQVLSEEQKIDLFRTVGSITNLRDLRVANSGLSGKDLKLITRAVTCANNLKSLTLHGFHSYITGNDNRRTAGAANIDVPELREFCQGLGCLRSLNSFLLENIEEDFELNPVIASLSALPALQHLSIKSDMFATNPKLTAESLAKLSSSTTLTTLSLNRLHLNTLLPAFIISLEDNKNLRSLNLEGNQMETECGTAIAYLIRFNDTLKELHLGCNLIADNSGREIAEALSSNTSLKVLSLEANFIEANAATMFGNMLAGNRSRLEFLNLSQNSIKDEGAVSLALALDTNTTLKTLVLSETRITKHTCDFLASSLATNSTLERLNIADNKVGDQSCFGFAEVLQTNTTLKSLNLFGNKIGNVGVMAIARALERNSAMEQLNLGNNDATDKMCCEALVKMMKNNLTLKHLWLPSSISSSDITFYLKLNRVGRGQLLQELDNEDLWFKAVTEVHNDVPSLFYLLRANPAVSKMFENDTLD